jgi:hypothetical protein
MVGFISRLFREQSDRIPALVQERFAGVGNPLS